MRHEPAHSDVPLLLLTAFICAYAALVLFGLIGCSTAHQNVTGETIPEVTHYFPPVYADTLNEDGTGRIVGVDLNGSPVMDRWLTNGDVLRGFVFTVACAHVFPQPPDPPGSKITHTLRAVFRGQPFHAPSDSVRGQLVYVEDVSDGPYSPAPVPDSLGQVTGGSYAFWESADTLRGLVSITLQGANNCKCLTPSTITLVKGKP